MPTIELKGISKKYDKNDHYSVKNINLTIEEKEFIVLVGPSGCGKSTVLRMIAGLENITDGDLTMNNRRMNDVEPKDRDIAMVFQNYALYPHMSVYDNMAFGLKIRKVPKKEIAEKVEKAAHILGLTDLLKRKPKALSGGQRQRVALGRAIVRNSNVFLMDEPLSNLDAKLRVQMRAEITKLHRRLGTTTIYVTHDQTEAMTMASRIVILKDGIIQQIGTPREVYKSPNNRFVASFIGSPGMNFITGKEKDHRFMIEDEAVCYELSASQMKSIEHNGHKPILLGIRPENIEISATKTPLQATIDFIETIGAEMFVHAKIANQMIIIKCTADETLQIGMAIYIAFNQEDVYLFDQESERRLFLLP